MKRKTTIKSKHATITIEMHPTAVLSKDEKELARDVLTDSCMVALSSARYVQCPLHEIKVS